MATPVSEQSDHGAGGSASNPTGTYALRKRYAQRLRGSWEPIQREIRAAVVDRAVFDLERREALSRPSVGVEALADPVPRFTFTSDEAKINEFDEWLRGEIDEGVLETIHRDDNEFIRSAYVKGSKDGRKQTVRELGDAAPPGIDAPEPEHLIRGGIHWETLDRLYTRNFEQLEGIAAETADAVRDELAEGLASGRGVRETARSMNDRIDAVGKHRSTVMARTETINAYNDAKLDRWERYGVEDVEMLADLTAVGDDRTCPVCASRSGSRMSIKEAREGSFSFGDRSHQMKPPLHPQCRCTLLPLTKT